MYVLTMTYAMGKGVKCDKTACRRTFLPTHIFGLAQPIFVKFSEIVDLGIANLQFKNQIPILKIDRFTAFLVKDVGILYRIYFKSL